MDLRIQKTRRAIRDAFLRLRREKNLEQITVKELAEAARISKATFYLHYRDIYDLSEVLQREAIERVISHMEDPTGILEDLARFMNDLSDALDSESEELSTLFSGSQMATLPLRLEEQLKKYIFEKKPHLKENPGINIHLSYHMQGGYHAYMENVREQGKEYVLEAIERIQKTVPPIL